jgi:hypothetical protein
MRATDLYNGSYIRFLVDGPGLFTVHFKDEEGPNVVLPAVFVDRVPRPAEPPTGVPAATSGEQFSAARRLYEEGLETGPSGPWAARCAEWAQGLRDAHVVLTDVPAGDLWPVREVLRAAFAHDLSEAAAEAIAAALGEAGPEQPGKALRLLADHALRAHDPYLRLASLSRLAARPGHGASDVEQLGMLLHDLGRYPEASQWLQQASEEATGDEAFRLSYVAALHRSDSDVAFAREMLTSLRDRATAASDVLWANAAARALDYLDKRPPTPAHAVQTSNVTPEDLAHVGAGICSVHQYAVENLEAVSAHLRASLLVLGAGTPNWPLLP